MTTLASHATTLGILAQYLTIAFAVMCAAAYVLHDRAPALSRRLRVAMAIPMVREGRPAWMRALGQRIAPPTAKGKTCGSCSGCAPD